MQDAQGFNPYKTGFVGGSDSHNTAVPYRQDNFFGGHGPHDGTSSSGCRARLRRPRRPAREPGRTDRRLGRGEHARLALRRHAAQGNLRHQRAAHQGALLRRRDYAADTADAGGLGQGRLRQRRADGRRPAAARRGQGADVHGLGGEGPDVGQSRPHPDRQGLDQAAARASRKSSTSPGPATASPTS